ncbi:Patatin [Citrus sinensis]|uniref:PNPLA domain-containing protein n=1 Tax=Citrus clementina TaxID=85681 RepID=V4T6Q4_CITCL|nr:hypothetical protein CICLE_v10022222mg [Citrus x clementina]KAH9659049.1 Patatin [Citrus sinensis]
MGRKRSILSQCDGDYQHNKIMEMLVVKFLHQTLTDVIIPTFDIRLLQPISFSTLKAKRNASKVSWLSDNCIGTSAAPYYLPPYYFEMHASTGTKKFNLVDGVAANIPTVLAICDVKKEISQNKGSPCLNSIDFSKFLTDGLKYTEASTDNSMKDNRENLEKIGKDLMKKPVSAVNSETGLYEPMEERGTYEDALCELAQRLSEERRFRHKYM